MTTAKRPSSIPPSTCQHPRAADRASCRGKRVGEGERCGSKFSLVAALGALALVLVAPAAAFDNLNPASTEANLDEAVPVNVVFVGYEFTAEQRAAFMAELPAPGTEAAPGYRVIERYPAFYVDNDPPLPPDEFEKLLRPLGLDYTYQYNVIDAPDAFENALWAKLGELATARVSRRADITLFQHQYNAQEKNVLDVEETSTSTRRGSRARWSTTRPPASTRRATTVFFVNWFLWAE